MLTIISKLAQRLYRDPSEDPAPRADQAWRSKTNDNLNWFFHGKGDTEMSNFFGAKNKSPEKKPPSAGILSGRYFAAQPKAADLADYFEIRFNWTRTEKPGVLTTDLLLPLPMNLDTWANLLVILDGTRTSMHPEDWFYNAQKKAIEVKNHARDKNGVLIEPGDILLAIYVPE